jgi:hypothetical protein
MIPSCKWKFISDFQDGDDQVFKILSQKRKDNPFPPLSGLYICRWPVMRSFRPGEHLSRNFSHDELALTDRAYNKDV